MEEKETVFQTKKKEKEREKLKKKKIGEKGCILWIFAVYCEREEEEEEEKDEEGGEEVLHLLLYTPFTHSFNRRHNSPAPDQKPRRRDLRRRKANQHSHLQIVPASENLPHRSRRGRLEEVDAFHRLQDSADLTRGNNAAVR